MKDIFRGAFNMNKEVFIEYAWANSELQARFVMCNRIAKKKKVHPGVIFSYFSGESDNYKIQKELEFEETNNAGA